MKIQVVLSLLVLGGLFFVFGQSTASKDDTLSAQTQNNLSTAMHGEAFAYAKYSLFAKQARQNGNEELADLFEKAANTERLEHFAEEARLAGLVGTDAENLRDAIEGESYEVNTMYREFAKQAAAAGDNLTADRFGEIRRDEMKHRDAFKTALKKVQVNRAAAR